MNKRAPLILFAIALAINGIIALVFWKTIRQAFVAPLSAFFMLVFDFISSFDQVYLWGIVLLILIIATIIRLGKSNTKETSNRVYHLKVTSAGRLRFWETQVYLLTRTRIPSRYSIHEVRRLVISVLGYKMHLDPAEAEKKLKAGELQVPPQYETFAELDQEPNDDQHDDRLTELFKYLMSVLQGKQQQVIQAREKVLIDLIQFMEKQMEIEHDH
jgi:hypothetical protein